MRHFITFRRTPGHCATYLVQAETLRDAIIKQALEDGATIGENGTLISDDGWGGKTVYEHPLAYIEAEEKVQRGSKEWLGWQIHELQVQHWEAEYAEVFCSENPGDVEYYIEFCRPLLRKHYQRSQAHAFVWYLYGGPLVTFYRSRKRRRMWPYQVLGRYQILWSEYPNPQEWQGTYDDILEQLSLHVPLPY